MKFFVAVLVLALVALSSASEEATAAAKPVQKLEPVNEPEAAVADGAQRDKRGFVLTAYTAPVAAAAVPAVEVASPYTAAYTAPVAYTYSAGLPYAYRAYSPYYSYPAVYV